MKKWFPKLKGEVAQRIMGLRKVHGYVDGLHDDEDDYQGEDLDEIKRLYQPVLDSEHGKERNGDEYVDSPDYVDSPAQRKARQLENIEAVIRAYKMGRLDWREGFVTYWSKGKQLCKPRPFDWDEFEAIYDKYEGQKSFWTEGVSSPIISIRVLGP